MESSLEDRIWESLFKEAQQLLRAGQHDEALKEFRGALKVAEKFGEEDQRLVQSINGLALAHSVRREFPDAEVLFNQAVKLTEKIHGSDHPDVAKVLKHLALVYSSQGQFRRAEETLDRVISIYERSAPTHPDLPVLREQRQRIKRNGVTATPSPQVAARSTQGQPAEIKFEAPAKVLPEPAPPPAEKKPAVAENTQQPVTGKLQPPTSKDKLIGTVLDNRYEVKERYGDGGMSVIYRGRHTLMDRPIAIKVLHAHLVSNERNIKRFTQEAKTASILTHQNIVTVRDFGVTSDGLCYMVMDFVEGENLASLVSKNKYLPAKRFVPILKQICDALSYAHENNVLHRDLKPSNVMVEKVGSREVAKIVDFGIAKIVSKEGEEQMGLTQTGETVGSPLYMSPEQCRGESLDVRSDVYSLGCLAYKVLAGVPPFFGRSNVDVYLKHVSEPPPPFSVSCPDAKVPAELEAIVMKALEKDPSNRQQSMHEIRQELDALNL